MSEIRTAFPNFLLLKNFIYTILFYKWKTRVGTEAIIFYKKTPIRKLRMWALVASEIAFATTVSSDESSSNSLTYLASISSAAALASIWSSSSTKSIVVVVSGGRHIVFHDPSLPFVAEIADLGVADVLLCFALGARELAASKLHIHAGQLGEALWCKMYWILSQIALQHPWTSESCPNFRHIISFSFCVSVLAS
jgi:hypothetical protein